MNTLISEQMKFIRIACTEKLYEFSEVQTTLLCFSAITFFG